MQDQQRLVVPGVDEVVCLGTDAFGPLWRGQEVGSGEPVELRRLPGAADLLTRDRVRQLAGALAAADHPHLLRVRRVVPQGDDALVLLSDAVLGDGLTAVLARRGRLAPGEVVTIGAPLSEALAALHAAGLTHGCVSAAAVRLTTDGRPMLGDAGLAALADVASSGVTDVGPSGLGSTAGTPPTERSAESVDARQGEDVHALAALCLAALSGAAAGDIPPGSGADPSVAVSVSSARSAPSPLTAALEAALGPDPARRPSAAAFAAALLAACPPAPVRLGARSGSVLIPSADPEFGPGGRKVEEVLAAVSADRPGVGRAGGPVDAADGSAGVPSGEGADAAPGPLTAGYGAGYAAVSGAVHRLRSIPRRAADRRRAGRRPAGPFAVTVALLVVGAGVGVRSGLLDRQSGLESPAAATGARPAAVAAGPQGGKPTAPSTSAPSTAPPSAAAPQDARWRQVVEALDSRRAEAFARAEPAALAAIYAPGAPARGRDAAALDLLRDRGLHAEGLRIDVLSAEPIGQADGGVVLAVTDRRPPYRIVDDAQRVRERREGRGPARWLITLVRVDGSWQFYDVAPAEDP